MKLVNQIKKLSFEQKRILAISVAVLLTVIIIIINSLINSVWKDDSVGAVKSKNDQIKSLQQSVSEIINQAKPIIDQTFGSSTQNTASGTEQIIGQNNSTSSSVSSSSNIVQ